MGFKKDNPDTLDVVEGFVVDNRGQINITFVVDNSQKSNFVFKMSAKSEFSLDNVSEENKASIKPPLESSIEFAKIMLYRLRRFKIKRLQRV